MDNYIWIDNYLINLDNVSYISFEENLVCFYLVNPNSDFKSCLCFSRNIKYLITKLTDLIPDDKIIGIG